MTTIPPPQVRSLSDKFRLEWRTWLKACLVGVIAGAGCGLIGFVLARTPKTAGMGTTMFYLVPFVAGFGIATLLPMASMLMLATLLSTLVALVFLVAVGAEGILCAVLVFPLLVAAICAGALVGYGTKALVGSIRAKSGTYTSIVFLAMPFAILLSHQLELETLRHARVETVTTTMRLPAKPEQVWAMVLSLDHVDGNKPFLMHVGLPIPVRCELKGTAAGSKRICYFDHGFIEETVLVWDPPHRLRMSIDRTNMPRRHWLGFEGAEYELHAEGNETVLTRTTTITSRLYPVWYWRSLEKWGVESEHRYVFSDLAQRFSTTLSSYQSN